jgi:hypothetical protein
MARFSEIIYGLQIARDVLGDKHRINAEHDIIFIELTKEEVTPAQAQELEDLGWHISSDTGMYAHFV